VARAFTTPLSFLISGFQTLFSLFSLFALEYFSRRTEDGAMQHSVLRTSLSLAAAAFQLAYFSLKTLDFCEYLLKQAGLHLDEQKPSFALFHLPRFWPWSSLIDMSEPEPFMALNLDANARAVLNQRHSERCQPRLKEWELRCSDAFSTFLLRF
jgi:hypothetical protein